ncbi:MAG: hypothetical protein PHH08_04485 [Candidatus ainarchaeum sp.]|nr:hypothetical protein [Candidatus ainarchaeum sp.]
MPEKKAQSSMEILIVVAIVIAMSTTILAGFNSIKDSTTGLGIAKANSLDALNKSGKSFVIQKIVPSESPGKLSLNIITSPSEGITCADINGSGTKKLLIEKGLYPAADLNIAANGADCG